MRIYGKEIIDYRVPGDENILFRGTETKWAVLAWDRRMTAIDARVGQIQVDTLLLLRTFCMWGDLWAQKKIRACSSSIKCLFCADGSVDLFRSKVEEKIECGTLFARRCKISGHIKVKSSLKLVDSHIASAEIGGEAVVQHSKIDHILRFRSNRAFFENSEIGTIQMLPENCESEPVLELKDCKVKKVIFEQGKGNVILSGLSPKPEVEGGTIARIDGGELFFLTSV